MAAYCRAIHVTKTQAMHSLTLHSRDSRDADRRQISEPMA